MRRSTNSPLKVVALGLVAGAAGTVAMDAVWYSRYKAGGGTDGFATWEFGSEIKSWDGAPAPALLGRRIYEGVLQRPLPPERAALTNNVVHWATGLGWSAGYALVAGSAPVPRARFGLAFGPLVWSSSYVVLPAAGLYQPIWKYDAKTLGKDLSAHVVYGMTTAAVFRVLAGRRRVLAGRRRVRAGRRPSEDPRPG